MRERLALKNPHLEARIFAMRISVASLVLLLMMAGIVWRYYHLQISRHEDFATQADNNRIHMRPVAPTRGLIFDRNGILLADNRPGLTLSIVVERSNGKDQLLDELDQLLGLDEAEIERFNKLLKRRRPYESVPLRYNLTEQEQSVIAVNEYRLEGTEIMARLVRYYPLANQLAHVIGYTGRINEQELRDIDQQRYRGTTTIGKTGLEKYYENILLGQAGYEHVEINARGRVMRVLDRFDPVPGENLHLFLDSRLQEIATNALVGERGAVVAIEIATGGVLAIASTPSFDPNAFVTGISHSDYAALIDSQDRPLFNRAVRGQYPPGSTVKPVFGLAALDSGVISENFRVLDPGYYKLDNDERKYRDWKRGGHGSRINLYQAVVQSCDTFFYSIGFKMGIDIIHRYGTMFGFGDASGVDLPGEAEGIMPSREWKHSTQSLAWYPGDTLNVSIGQGFMLATPIQLAVVASRLATRGQVRTPKLVDTDTDTDTESTANGKISGRQLQQIKAASWQAINDGMTGVVHDVHGTASQAVTNLAYKMAGKTGTAQVVGIKQDEKYDAEKLGKLQLDHALFIAFAPVDKPRIAVAVIVENGEHGSSTAAPVARDVIDSYLNFYPLSDTKTDG
jgi:penicillin-binding protein 2